MEQALGAAEFLARSENRVAVLLELDDAAAGRDELRTETGASQVTIGRVLGDLTDRGWIESTGESYEITPLGRVVAASFADLLDALDVTERLRPFSQWMPLESYDFDLVRLADAEVVRPDSVDPSVTMRKATQQVADSTHVRILTHGFSTMVTEVLHDRVLAGEAVVEGVFSPAVFAVFEDDPALIELLTAMMESDGATFYRYDGDIPHILTVVDDGVGIAVDDDDGLPRAILDVDDPAVREWAVETFERYRAAATRIESPDGLLSNDPAE